MDILFIALFIFIGFLFINSFKASLSSFDISTLQKLFVYHLLFGLYYCLFIRGDAYGHWMVAKSFSTEDFIFNFTQSQGSYFSYALNYIPSNVLGLSYFTGTILYSLIGFIGLTYFYIIAVKYVPFNSKFGNYNLFPLLFFSPSLHFWSCAVGKDTLLFFCIGIFMYGILKPIKRLPMIILGLTLAYFIRPHMTLFMLLAYAAAYFTTSKVSFFQRIVFFGLLIGVSFFILPSVMKFAKVEDSTLESFNDFAESKSFLLSRSTVGSAIDISSYPFPLKVVTFLYRPLFFDAHNVMGIFVSIENLFLVFLSIKIIRNKPLQAYRKAPFVIQGMVWFLIIGTLAFSQSLGNLGIMIRMRNMFLPGMLIFILWTFSYRQQLLKGKNNKMS
jgi:hypothetical protein